VEGWDPLATARGNGPCRQHFSSGRDAPGLRLKAQRLKEMGEVVGGFEYPAVNAAIARFEQRLKIDPEHGAKKARGGAVFSRSARAHSRSKCNFPV